MTASVSTVDYVPAVPDDGPPPATVVITTHNRKGELRRALDSVLRQSVPVEVLVMDDGSTDGTADLIADQFPGVRLERSEQSQGYITQRNRAAQLSRGPVVFSLDDDAEFSSPMVVEQTLREFDDPRIGAVAIPFRDVLKGETVWQRAPDAMRCYVIDSYVGTAHAVRRDLFLRLGGYRTRLFHQGEEADFCIRLLEAGYFVRAGHADPVLHYESPQRDFRRRDIYGRRNDVLYAWFNVPGPDLPLHLCGTTARGLLFGLRQKRLLRMAVGLLRGYAACLREFRARRPVSRATYRLLRRLKKGGPQPLDAISPTDA